MPLGKFSSIIICTWFHHYYRIQSTYSRAQFSEQSAACAHVSPVARQQQAHLIKKRLTGDAAAPQSLCGMSVQHRTNLLTKWPCAAASISSPAELDVSLCLRPKGESSSVLINVKCVCTYFFLFPGFSTCVGNVVNFVERIWIENVFFSCLIRNRIKFAYVSFTFRHFIYSSTTYTFSTICLNGIIGFE